MIDTLDDGSSRQLLNNSIKCQLFFQFHTNNWSFSLNNC